MNQNRKDEILDAMMRIGKQVDSHLDTNMQERTNITYYKDFRFGNSNLGINNVYKVDTPLKKAQKTVDKNVNKIMYEIYDEDARLIATVTEDGKTHFDANYLEELKEINPKYFEQLNLDDTDFELPEELREEDIVMTKEELQEYGENKLSKARENKKLKDDKEQVQEEKGEDEEKNNIAEKKGIPQSNILKVKEKSNFYKDHPNLEPNLYFYRDNDGVVRAEYLDENGELQPSKYIETSTTAIRQETVDIGKDGNSVERIVPYQVMMTKGLTSKDQDVRAIRINVNIDTYGYLEISEARQGMNGEWAAHDIEVKGRTDNSYEINEETSMKTRRANPDEITETYLQVEDTSLLQDGVQYDEMYLMRNSDEIIERFIKEGYQKDEAIQIFNYMIGEETLTEKEAKERVNEEIEEKEKALEEKVENETENEEENDDERTPWGDAEDRRNRNM